MDNEDLAKTFLMNYRNKKVKNIEKNIELKTYLAKSRIKFERSVRC